MSFHCLKHLESFSYLDCHVLCLTHEKVNIDQHSETRPLICNLIVTVVQIKLVSLVKSGGVTEAHREAGG